MTDTAVQAAKTTKTTTPNPAPPDVPLSVQAAKAHAEAARLAALVAADNDAREQRVTRALDELAEKRFRETSSSPTALARDAAGAEWKAVTEDRDATIDDLFRAWIKLRATNAAQVLAAQQNAADADSRLGVKKGWQDMDVPRPRPAVDPLERVSFAEALESDVIRPRAWAAVQAATAARTAETQQVTAKAERDA